MKTLNTLAVVSLIALFLSACSDDEAYTLNPSYDAEATGEKPNLPIEIDTIPIGGGGSQLTPPYLVAEINGVYTEFSTTLWETEIDSAQGANNESAYGYTSTPAELYFGIERPVISDTTYAIDLFTAVGSYRSDTNSTDSATVFLIVEGSIDVEEFSTQNNLYSGSFSFKGYNFNGTDSVIVTNGLFELEQ
ncbi:MAG: hypothetical protein RIC95_01005 [Vicingaceae bacterium]